MAEHGRVGKGRYSDASIRAISWMRMFFNKVGDRMPMKDDVHLPSCLTKADVYSLASDDLCQGGLGCCSRASFYRIWKEEFPHVKIPRVRLKISSSTFTSFCHCVIILHVTCRRADFPSVMFVLQ